MKKLVQEIENEGDIHNVLKSLGFETNYKKHINDSGVDVIALKNGRLKVSHWIRGRGF